MSSGARLAAAILLTASACTAERDAGTAGPSPPASSPAPTAVSTPRPTHAPLESVVWVAAEDARRIVEVDVGSHRALTSLPVPGRPHNMTVGPDGSVVAALQWAGTVALVRGGEVIEVRLGGSPHDVKPIPEGFVVANEGAARLDLLSPSGEHTGSIPLRANPHDVAVSTDGETAWASLDESDDLAVVSLEGREVRRYISTGQRPHDLLFAPDGRVWVTDWRGPLHVFTSDGDLVRTLDLGEEAHHLTFEPDGEAGWVVDHGTRQVHLVGVDSLELLASLPLPGAPHHVAVTADGEWAVVADHTNGAVVVFDAATRERIATVPVGAGPHGVWATPAGA